MSAAQITALPDRKWAPVIIATGAIEQHGPHLPVAVDSLLGQVWLNLLLARLPAGVSCYVAPPITIGKSNEHVGFPGTLYISKTTLRLQLVAIARQLHEWGFKELVVLNTHGGNSAVINYTLREIRALYGPSGLRISPIKSDAKIDVSPQESAYGFHANEVETSLLLAAAPAHTRMKAAVCHYPSFIGDPGELRPENAPATYSWASQDISPTGIMGDATAASAEKGAQGLDLISTGMTADIVHRHNEGRRRATTE